MINNWIKVRIKATGQVIEMAPAVAQAFLSNGSAELFQPLPVTQPGKLDIPAVEMAAFPSAPQRAMHDYVLGPRSRA